MIKPKRNRTDARAAYRGALRPGFALLLVAPITFVLLSMAATVLAAGSALMLLLPAFLRKRSRRSPSDEDCVVLRPDQYSRLSDDPPRLPR